MSEVWVTSTLLPAHKVSFNWKITNFAKWLKVFGKLGIDSPEFKIKSSDNKVHLLKLRLDEFTGSSSYPVLSIQVDGGDKSLEDFMLLQVKVVDTTTDIKFPLAGTLEFVLDGKTSSSAFGNPELDDFNNAWTFINSRSKTTYRTEYNNATFTSGFCVAKVSETLQLKVKLTNPGYMSNSISLVPNEYTVKETGGTRLMADMKSLLSRADEYADFTIFCESKNFPCHEAILRARSPVLDKMFLQKMKESSTRELIVEDVGEDIIDAFLEYLYTGELTRMVENESELIYIADKYSVAGLLELCFHKFSEVKEDMVVDILVLADRHNLEDFKKVAIQRILMDKTKFFKDEDFVTKMKLSPHLLVELVKL